MFHLCLRPIIIVIAAHGLLQLGFGQSSPATANGDEFNSATVNNGCYANFQSTGRTINDAYSRNKAQIDRSQASSARKEKERAAAASAANRQQDIAKARLYDCQTKPRSATNQRPVRGTAISPKMDPSADQPPPRPVRGTAISPAMDPSADQPPPRPFKGGVNTTVNNPSPANDGYPPPKVILEGTTQDNQGRPSSNQGYKPRPPVSASIPTPLNAGTQRSQDQRAPSGYVGEVIVNNYSYGRVQVDPRQFQEGQNTKVHINRSLDKETRDKKRTIEFVWGTKQSNQFFITQIQLLGSSQVIKIDPPTALYAQ